MSVRIYVRVARETRPQRSYTKQKQKTWGAAEGGTPPAARR